MKEKLYANRNGHAMSVLKPLKIAGLMLVMLMTLYSSFAYSPDGLYQAKFNITLRNVTIDQVFNAIRKQSSFKILYNDELLRKAGKVSIDVRNADINEVLTQCLSGQPLGYKIVDETIIITPRVEGKQGGGASEDMQLPPIDIHGKVLNQNGEPLEGVTVTVKGTTKGTSTNANGEFSLSTVDPNAVLVFSSVNMETFELEVSGKAELIVNLKAKVTALGDVVVVNTGYQTLKPNEVTGSVVVVGKDQLDKRVASDVISKLEGITNGVTFNKRPNGDNQIRIRGESTIFGIAEPLIVIDNAPFDGDILSLDINPNDVEDVTILKDAAAASIYGIRAGNGVIVITTKKGKLNQQLRLSLTANTTITEQPDLYAIPQIGANDFIDFETNLFNKGYYNSSFTNVNMPALSPVVEILNRRKLGQISAADSASQIDRLRNLDYREDFSKYLYRKAISQQYYLSISGGTSRASYSLSGGYDKIQSSLIGNESDRITLNSQSFFKPLKGLEINFGLNYTEGNNTTNAFIPGNIFPYTKLKDENGIELSLPLHRATWEDTVGNGGFLNWKMYPLQERKARDYRVKTNNTRIATTIKYAIYKGLSIEGTYQYQHYLTEGRNHLTEESYDIRDKITSFAILQNGKFIGSNYPLGGKLDVTSTNFSSHYGRINLSFNHTWQNHRITAIGGFEAKEAKSERDAYVYYGYDDENGSFANPNLFMQYSRYPSGSGYLGGSSGNTGLRYTSTLNRFRAYFFNGVYGFKDRYFAQFSTRVDGSNLFGVKTNLKTVPLWSASAKWIISNENFFNAGTFSYLSLRTSYGFNGNVDPNTVAVPTIQYQASTSLTGLPYAVILNKPNPELRWEKSRQFNVGIDFSFKKDILRGSLEYFEKNGDDLIGDQPLDPTTGVTTLRGNFSGLRTRGVDIGLSSRIGSKTIQWVSTLNFNYAAEKVTKYDITPSIGQYFTAVNGVVPHVGKPLYRLFSYRWAGLDPATGDPRIYAADTMNKVYQNATITSLKESDLVYHGRYNAPLTANFSNRITWKGISLDFNIAGKFNYYYRRASVTYSAMVSDWKAGHPDYAKRWKSAGDELTTNVPSFIYPFPSGNSVRESFYLNSELLVKRRDNIRLQFVNLSYSINDALLKRLRAQAISIYLYINNVALLWKADKDEKDPEYIMGAPPRSYSFGVRTTF